MSFYPPGWPVCACGAPVLDGHFTCGALACGEGEARRRRVEAFRRDLDEERLGVCIVLLQDGRTLDLSDLTIDEAAERVLAAGYTLRDVVVSATSRRPA